MSMPFTVTLGICNRAGPICPMTSRIFASRTGPRRLMCALAGCGPWRTSTTPSRSSALRTSSRTLPTAIQLEYLLDLIGKPRIVDLNGAEYPNYGASYDKYPIDTGRLRNVLTMVAEKAGWGTRKLGKGSGMGIAVHRSFLTYVASAVAVEVSDQGQVRIPRVDTVVDAGLVVNPEATRAQFEGAAVFGTSIVRSGEITATKGVINQSSFQDYAVARINEAPYQTNVHIVESDAPPAGVGEPGVPPFVAAYCNAIFAATGKRVRELPFGKYNLS